MRKSALDLCEGKVVNLKDSNIYKTIAVTTQFQRPTLDWRRRRKQRRKRKNRRRRRRNRRRRRRQRKSEEEKEVEEKEKE